MLQYAVISGMYDAARMVLERGANPNTKSSTWRSETALHLAAVSDDARAVAAIAEAALHDLNVNAPDGLGRTPLAISPGADVAAALIRIGAKCEARPVLCRCAVIRRNRNRRCTALARL